MHTGASTTTAVAWAGALDACHTHVALQKFTTRTILQHLVSVELKHNADRLQDELKQKL